jgi:hypothetical protein
MRTTRRLIVVALVITVAYTIVVGCVDSPTNNNRYQLRLGTIRIKVLNDDSLAVSGATVELNCEANCEDSFTETTNSAGWAYFVQVPVAKRSTGGGGFDWSGGTRTTSNRWYGAGYRVIVSEFDQAAPCDMYQYTLRLPSGGGSATATLTPQEHLWTGRPCAEGETSKYHPCCQDTARM